MQNRNPFISIILYTLKYAIIMLSFIILMQFVVTHIITVSYTHLITPYITASIILQLLTIVIRPLEKLQRNGEVGQQTFKKYTIILGVILAFMESFGFAYGFGQKGLLLSFKWYWVCRLYTSI